MKGIEVRIVLLDCHELDRAGMRLLIEKQPGYEVVGEEGSLSAGYEIIRSLQPDIVLLDMNLDAQTDSDGISRILKVSNKSRIIFIATINNPITIQQVVESGVAGVVFKNQSPQILYKAIEKVHAGEVWLERSMIANVLSRLSRNDKTAKSGDDIDNIKELSDREKEIIGLIGLGYKNRRIAEQLCISETTVRHHLTSIYSKLGVSDRLELLVFAHRFGLVKPLHK